jgi:hypothetical protein
MKIKKLILRTVYLQTLREFYSSILELPVQMANQREMVIKIGDSELIFIEVKGSEPVYHFAINIPSNKIEESREWLSRKLKLIWIEEYKNDIAEFVTWRARSVYFFDPAGNILELIARFDLRNEASEMFSSKQFLSISEVGLVFEKDEFEQRTSALLNDYPLTYFNKQLPLPQFRAIGDDEGLFVVVPSDRNWYPTNSPSEIFPIKVEFIENDRKYQLTTNEKKQDQH